MGTIPAISLCIAKIALWKSSANLHRHSENERGQYIDTDYALQLADKPRKSPCWWRIVGFEFPCPCRTCWLRARRQWPSRSRRKCTRTRCAQLVVEEFRVAVDVKPGARLAIAKWYALQFISTMDCHDQRRDYVHMGNIKSQAWWEWRFRWNCWWTSFVQATKLLLDLFLSSSCSCALALIHVAHMSSVSIIWIVWFYILGSHRYSCAMGVDWSTP